MKVFISYRRGDSRYQARQMYAALAGILPDGHVFMDVDSIPLGKDFRQVLQGWVGACDLMLVLIGDAWVGSTAGNAARRIDDPADFVRIEVGTALARGIPVVPVLLDGARFPDRAALPADIQPLVDRQAEYLSFHSFDEDVARLIRKLGLAQAAGATGAAPEAVPTTEIASDEAQAADTVTVPELRVEAPVAPADDPDAAFVAGKLARNVAEFLVESGVRVSSELTGRQPSRAPTHFLHMRVTRSYSELAIAAEIVARDGAIHALANLSGPADFLREHYKVLPEALIWAMDVSPSTLAPLHSAKHATGEPVAYAAFLAARRMASAKRLEDAGKLLEMAIGFDPSFGAAHAGLAEIAELTGAPPDVALAHQKTALGLDPDFRRLRLFAPSQMGNPVAVLRAAASSTAWTAIAPELEYRCVEAPDHGVAVHAWRFDPARFHIGIERASGARGETVADLRARAGALLAVNAGFFDLDMRSRLAPVGLLVVDGREVNAFDPEKAKNPLTGILYREGASFGIVPVRERHMLGAPEIAVQSGPLVVDPGGRNGIRTNNFDRLNRSAIGLDWDGRVVVAHVVGGLSLFEFGDLMASRAPGGLDCERAINLDGGPSSQVSAATPGLALESRGLWTINSALVVKSR